MSDPVNIDALLKENRVIQASAEFKARAVVTDPSTNIIREIMFHEEFEEKKGRTARNAGFRELDQSWRLTDEDPGAVAIVYGVVASKSGPAAEVIPATDTVTRLWLGALPGSDPAQRNLSGTIRQETHVRFFVPVKKGS